MYKRNKSLEKKTFDSDHIQTKVFHLVWFIQLILLLFRETLRIHNLLQNVLTQ